jgi:hypothetical protein
MSGQRFFQIRKDDIPVDDRSYPSLAQASLSWREAPQGSEIVEIDVLDTVQRRFTPAQSQRAAKRFLSPI